MTIDEAISFCDEKSKNIKLKAEPQTFIDIKEMLEELKAMRNLDKTNFSDGYNKAIDDVLEKAKEIQLEQIDNFNKSSRRNGKMWTRYMITYLGHIQNACTRLIKEQLRK